jgi:hypothetical protein
VSKSPGPRKKSADKDATTVPKLGLLKLQLEENTTLSLSPMLAIVLLVVAIAFPLYHYDLVSWDNIIHGMKDRVKQLTTTFKISAGTVVDGFKNISPRERWMDTFVLTKRKLPVSE